MKASIKEIEENKPKFKPFELKIQIDDPIELMELWLLLNRPKADLYLDAREFFTAELVASFVNTASTSTSIWKVVENKCNEFELLKQIKKGKRP